MILPDPYPTVALALAEDISGGDLTALAGTIDAFEGDEAGFHGDGFRM